MPVAWTFSGSTALLQIDDHIVHLPPLPLPENTEYNKPLVHGIYTCFNREPNKRLKELLIMTIDKDPNFFINISGTTRWFRKKTQDAFKFKKVRSRIMKKNGNKRARKGLDAQQRVVELE